MRPGARTDGLGASSSPRGEDGKTAATFYLGGMATTWVLHTETKGTGAQMVPLEGVRQRPSDVEPVLVPRKALRDAEPEAPKPRAPRRFRIVDVMTRQNLVDGASTREAIDALRDVRSIVDVTVYVWDEEHDRWRLVMFAEQSAMLDLARAPAGEERAPAGEERAPAGEGVAAVG